MIPERGFLEPVKPLGGTPEQITIARHEATITALTYRVKRLEAGLRMMMTRLATGEELERALLKQQITELLAEKP